MKEGGIFYLDKCLATQCKMQLVSIEYENEFHKFFNVKDIFILREVTQDDSPNNLLHKEGFFD